MPKYLYMTSIKNILFLLLQFSIILNFSFAQSFRAYIKAGDSAFEQGNYYGAANMYKKALDINRNVVKLAYKYADACRMNRDYNSAEKWYETVVNKDKGGFPLAIFWLADMQKSQGKYQKAQKNYRQYYQKHRKDRDYYSKKAKHEIVSCEKAMLITFEPEDINIIHLDTSINTVYSEFGTYDMNDSILYYSSLRPLTKADTNIFYARIYQTIKKDSLWKDTGIFDTIINSSKYHVSNLSFSPDKQTMYFSMSLLNNSTILPTLKLRQAGISQLYRSKFINWKWQNPELLPASINQPNTNTTHPCFARTKNGDFLLFVSDRSGGFGKYDIWYCPIDSTGNFGDVRNLGKTINSIDDEVTPFYNTMDKTLYFSSKWYNNLGGYDIFKSKGNFKHWEKPNNMASPINTNYDDLYYSISSNRKNAYFSSNREGSYALKNESCCNDIYMYKLPAQPISAENEIEIFTKQAKQLIPISLYFDNDEPNPRTLDTVTSLNYQTTFTKYLEKIDKYKKEYSKTLRRKEKQQAIEEIENFFIDNVEKGLYMLNEFFGLLEELLTEGQTIVITLKGYASPLNTSDYNDKLAKRRISSLINYYKEYNNGIFINYINGTSSKGNKLIFKKEALGEEYADKEISDDLHDLRSSVYSPDASLERKIQVIAVSVSE